uniref:RB1-inducible coiled-coil protein 1 n=1 Tax=Scleropages formosus TaxID=113540 RepID=A0A8C9V133_SCLFO
MKLYVFQVNNGSTLTFDTELAVQTVADLKHAIQAKYKIATQHQVLVVNGGECMVAERRVCSYSAGTDTNPIFLFNKEMILCDRAPTIPKTTFSIENEMAMKVEESLMMPAVFHTVASRTQLAVEMFEVAKKLCSFCERLVHDEHLQHQGWAAIMANLDDCTLSYQKLLWRFETAYTNYQQDIEEIKLKLTKLGTAVSVMARIPLLECLTRHSYKESLEKPGSPSATEDTEEERSVESVLHPGSTASSSKATAPLSDSKTSEGESQGDMTDSRELRAALQEEESPERSSPPQFNVSLLDWVNVQDRPNDVESVVRKCFDSINRLDPRIIQPFLTDCRDTIAKLDNQNMKAIKGLEDRLYALDQMIASCKKLVNEQKELAQGFLANQMRAENLKDTSVLPDLCLSHANQLMIMLNNHRKLLDIKHKCTTAKQELANNLQVRLKWCCYVMLHADQDGERLQALLRLLTELLERVRVVEALSTVPQMYCLSVVEVVRRKVFVRHYREWASALVKDGKRLYEAEKAKRETFGKLFSECLSNSRKSFLRNRLFRGLDSWPPASFCTRKPRKFDFELPDISLADLQYLKSCCPSEVQPFLSVPTLCDFEPLHQHSQMLHQLVQATQSVDEMSQTITDLLSEQKASSIQMTQRSMAIPRSESTTGTTSTSPKTPSSLSLQGALCQPLTVTAPLEELSPDSIDAHTFDFETIGHPNMDPVLQQGSLDLDSLAESPESDFLSAVNEFVIEENLTSPNPISDPTSPEMMGESLYSSVINAIDSKRIQDTTTLERENSRVAILKACIDKYRSAAEESQGCLRSVKDDLHHFRGLVLKEHRDFGFALKTMSIEVRNTMDSVQYSHLEDLKQRHQDQVQALQRDYEKKLLDLQEESAVNLNIVKDLQRAMLELEGIIGRKEREVSQLESERDNAIDSVSSLRKQLEDLKKEMAGQSKELRDAVLSRDSLITQLENLHFEIERSQQKIKQEMESLERAHLREVEERLQRQHATELEEVRRESHEARERLAEENVAKLKELVDLHTAELREREDRLQDLEQRFLDLSDVRCKLEMEMALKEAEMEEMRLLYEEAKGQQEEALALRVTSQTESLRKEVEELRQQLRAKNEEYEVGLAELRTLMRLEKDHCISELVDRHEEESTLLRSEFTALQHSAQVMEKEIREEVQALRVELNHQTAALQSEKDEHQRSLQEQLRLKTLISDLQAENELLSEQLAHEKEAALLSVEEQKEKAVRLALAKAHRDSEQEKQAIEQRLVNKGYICFAKNISEEKPTKNRLEKICMLDVTMASGPSEGHALLSTDLEERLQEERASLVAQLELLEKKKNEEMQNLKTSLIAEQQTNFNTVLTREKLKKEQIISELSEKLSVVTQQQEKDKGLIETLQEDRANLLQEKKQLEEELNRLRSSALLSSAFFAGAAPPADTLGTGVASACAAAEMPADLERLASVATARDDERLESAVEASMMTMSQSMSSVSSRHSEKIAIRDFQVGDLVLIILDERHDNYVLFTVGPTLYFLHSESLAALDLKPASGAARRPWVLGKVMEKEYCQAKKAQNRFKVPLGTKFYRVKAVPWNKKV